ncbi:uncharacterized protein BKA78DRAFT_132814 [Phyllosticta capitalensis]|uniref:uncharacterized protein n=1 Tax=Phyllosticta capitalensis TaxID=121624 RepID=UPI00312E628F
MLTARSACVLIGSTPSRSNSTNSTLRLAYGSSACSRPITIYQPSSFFQLQLSHLLFLLAPWFAASRRRFLSVLDVPLFHSFDNSTTRTRTTALAHLPRSSPHIASQQYIRTAGSTSPPRSPKALSPQPLSSIHPSPVLSPDHLSIRGPRLRCLSPPALRLPVLPNFHLASFHSVMPMPH